MTRRKNPSEFDAILAAATASDDLIIWWDTSAGKMYSITKSEFLTMVTAGSGDMSTSTYDPASIAEQLVGLTAAQTITNKTIDADNNTVSNIGDEELKAGIDAAKIADASVSNTEFQYLNGVTSAIQTQIDGKADSSHTHTLTDITDSGALAALDTVGTSEIDDEAVTLAKLAHVPTNRVLARSSAGSGDVEALTLPNFRTLINVENGADVTDTTNVTAAGALMDSEVTDLAGIKSLDTSTLQVKPTEGAFVDGDKTKLDGIETGADVTDETNVVSALSGATLTDAGTPQATDKVLVQDSSDSDNLKYVDFSDFSSGTTVDVVSNVAADRILGRVTAGSGDSEELTAAQVRSLINVEDGATADQTGAEIKAAYEGEADTNAYTDAEKSKLAGISAGAEVNAVDSVNSQTGAVVLDADDIDDTSTTNKFATSAELSKLAGIETGADVTDTANVTAAGALMDSEVTDLAGIKALDTSTLQVKPAEGAFVDGDKTKLDGIETGADVTDTANVTAAGALMDSEVDADIKTLSLPANTTISTFGASLVDDADASAARTTLGISTASKTAEGLVELATTAEIDTGTDTTRAMPIDQFVASKRNIEWIVFDCVDPDTDCAVGTNIAGDFVSPIAGTILQSDSSPFYLYATNSTAGAPTGTMVVDVNINGTTIMTTNKLDFDATEKTTTTAATPPDLTTTSLAVGDIITIDIDSVHVTPAKGLKVYMGIRQ